MVKIMLYLLSLEILHIFIIISTLEIKFFKGINTARELILNYQFYETYIKLANNPKAFICMLSFLLFLIGIISLVYLKCKLKKDYKGPKKVIKIEKTYDHISFISTYVVPLIAFSYTEWNQVLLYIVYLIFLGFIYMKTGQYSTNPTLLIWGFNIYNVEFKENEKFILITSDEIAEELNIKYVVLDEKVKIIIGGENK